MNGYVKYHRQIVDWEWYTDANVFRLFTHCLLMANHKDNTWRGIEVKAGSFITSYEKLSLQLSLSVQQIRTALKKLNNKELTIKTTNKYTVITVNNWCLYQNNEDLQQSNNNQITIKQQSNNNQITTNKNDKNVKNDNNDKNNTSLVKRVDESFYKMSEYMFAKIQEINPKAKSPNFDTWANDFRKIIELDKRDVNETGLLIDLVYQNDFWQSNILSPSKLRKQYDQLYTKLYLPQVKKKERIMAIIEEEPQNYDW